jgi:DNA-binding CsgD family transcriptional regulator
MKRLPYEDLHRVSGILPEVYAHTDIESFPRFTAEVVQRFVDADLIEYNVVAPEECVLTQQPTSPEGSQRYPAFKVHLDKNPLLRPGFVAIHDCRSAQDSRTLAASPRSNRLDHEFYRLLDVSDQLAIGFQGKVEAWVNIVLNRWRRSFNTRDALVLEFLQPHLAQAHCNAAALAESRQRTESFSGAFASMHRGLVVLDHDGRVLWMTKRAEQWLSSYFPRPLDGNELPAELQRWIQIRRASQKQNGNFGLPAPLVIAQPESRLIVRYSEDSRARQFLFLKEEKTGVCPAEFVRLGLTQREGEVLYWICQGKSNPEIAAVEGISLRTVHKHVEHILAKLGVETRVAAMLTALQTLDQSDTGREALLEG